MHLVLPFVAFSCRASCPCHSPHTLGIIIVGRQSFCQNAHLYTAFSCEFLRLFAA
jgi:hypothetical protein